MNINNVCKPHKRIYNLKKFDLSIMNVVSYYNLVMFYKKELLSLMRNRIAKDIFSEAEQNSLMDKMVYIPCHFKDKNNIRFIGTSSTPSCLTRMIITGFIKIDVKELLRELDKIDKKDTKND